MSDLLVSPTEFVVHDYEDGFGLDFRAPAAATDIDERRRAARIDTWPQLTLEEQLARAEALAVDLGLSEQLGDLARGICSFAGADDVRDALRRAAEQIGAPRETERERLAALLATIGATDPPRHLPTMLRCHQRGESLSLGDEGTHFGVVLPGGRATLHRDGLSHDVPPLHYFGVPGPATLTGDARVVVITRLGHRGMFVLGGPIEEWGRLRYIDGCTDTLLIPPPRIGDPCLNALYFPPRTRQTEHAHPSLRAGVVVSGRGVCVTPRNRFDLAPGKIFFLPPETRHAFHTSDSEGRSALCVVAFHPDSDYGPDDDDHPMLNRTYMAVVHRLRSAERIARHAKG